MIKLPLHGYSELKIACTIKNNFENTWAMRSGFCGIQILSQQKPAEKKIIFIMFPELRNLPLNG